MTATLAPPPPSPAPAGDGRRRRHVPTSTSGSVPLLAIAETALAAVTVAAVLGLGRLFEDGSFLLPVLTVGAGAHLLAAWCRRSHLSSSTTFLVGAAGLLAVISWLLLPATTAYGIPTPATLAELQSQLASAMTVFREVVAPAPVEPGFVLASAIGVWIVAFVADTAAFRAGAVIEAAIPGATLFLFGAALGAPRQRELTTALFLTGLLAYWLAQRASANAASPTWLSRDTVAGSRALLRTGTALGAVVVLLAVLGGPLLPGASDKAVIPWRASDREDGGSRVTVSPLVDIQARIVNQSDSVMFTVTSAVRSYWRLTSLETFDGRIWSSTRSYKEADGALPTGSRLEEVPSEQVTQEFEMGALASIWLPAAYRPVGVEGTEASYDAESASLIVPAELDVTQPGQRYQITSVLPRLTSAALASAPAAAPREIVEAYTALPDDFSDPVEQEALRITGAATTPYAKALALQDHFRSGAFTYDLTVERGHSGNDLERFLFETRTGYCEQFAGAYAAMARSVGLPARVAVGFTPGEVGPDGRFVVRGLNAHAWPEVYLEGYGWVPFEPTPGRGIPGATAYTGLPEQQASLGDPTTATTLPARPEAAPLDPTAGATDTTLPEVSLGEDGVDVAVADEPSPWPRRLLIAGLVLVGLPALWVGAVATGSSLRHRRRRSTAQGAGAGARVELAWTEVGEALTSVGTVVHPWETPTELAGRAGATQGADPQLLAALAGTVTTASYAAGGAAEADAERAEAHAATLVDAVHATHDPRQRLRRALDPRPLLPQRAARRRVGPGPADDRSPLRT